MSELRSKFNQEYRFLEDPEIFSLQSIFDECYSDRDVAVQQKARIDFVEKLKEAFNSCVSDARRSELLHLFLQSNIRFLWAGGIGKDLNNPVVMEINNSIEKLQKIYPNFLNT
jgi:hypothetical protein